MRDFWASGVVEKEKLSGKRRFKIFFFPASACAGKKENSAVQNGTVSVSCFFFFLTKKRKCNLEEPKNGL
jgi:ABC-type polysaccharide/polyol phosphate export permease